MIEPKACPFCNQPLSVTLSVNPIAKCETPDCFLASARISFAADLDKDVARWNNRAPDPAIDALQAENERLRALVQRARKAMDDMSLGIDIHNNRRIDGFRRIEGPVVNAFEDARHELRQALDASHDA